MNITVIIVTYNAMPWAEKCFSSLRASSVPVTTLVVDNGSTDGTQEFIQKNYPEVEFIQNPSNEGFGKANNIGLEMAYHKGADFFYLLNQDAWLYPNTIEELLNVYTLYPHKKEIGLLSPFHVDGSEQKLDVFMDKYIAQNYTNNRLISDLYFNTLQDFYEFDFINAAHWFLPKNTIEEIGGFNSYFFHYGEDNEYVNRLKFHGKKVLLCSKSKAVHDGKQSLKKVDYSQFKNKKIEINIMNPNSITSLEKEIHFLRLTILKNVLSGNLTFAKNKLKKYKRITKEGKQLLQLKNKVSSKGASFLNIEKK